MNWENKSFSSPEALQLLYKPSLSAKEKKIVRLFKWVWNFIHTYIYTSGDKVSGVKKDILLYTINAGIVIAKSTILCCEWERLLANYQRELDAGEMNRWGEF